MSTTGMLVNRTAAAAIIGVSPKAIRKAEGNGRLARPKDGKYDPAKLKRDLEASRTTFPLAVDDFKRRKPGKKGTTAKPGKSKKQANAQPSTATSLDTSQQVGLAYTAERIKEKRSERELKELKLAVVRKDLVSRIACEREAEETGTMVSEALESIVDRLASRLAAEKDELRIREMMLAEFDLFRDAIANRITHQFAG